MYEDDEECRRMFKFLKSEHVGGTALIELYLHWAKFELSQGKEAKALSVLQSGLESSSTLQRNPQLLSAIEVLKLTGKLNVSSVLHAPTRKASPKSTLSIPSAPLQLKESQEPSMPAVDESLQYSQMRRESLNSVASVVVPRISLSDPPNSALSSISRLRRVGLGPPKRTNFITSSSVPIPLSPINDDSTVPKTIQPQEEAPMSTPPRQRIRNQGAALSIDPSPLSNISRSRLNYTDAPLTDVADDDDDDSDESLEKEKDKAALDNVVDNLAKSSISSNRIATNLKTEEPIIKTRAVKINGKTYRVLHLIGKGGSSKVFKVLGPDNQVLALKKVHLKNLDEATLSGYINEIELLKSLGDDEHIIKLVDAELNRQQGSLYMVLEYGEIDLAQMLKQRSAANGEGVTPENYNWVRCCWQQMLTAVQRVHAAKVVHCDLKPANFLLVRGRLKLIDFGISKAILNDTTNIVRENQVGTVNYMSPEALQESNSGTGTRGNGMIKIGRPSDVWSLGCILYEMSHGKPPFAAFSLVQRLQRIMDPNYQIEFPSLPDSSLFDAIQGCLTRPIKSRLTIEQLLRHSFLIPQLTLIPEGKVLVSKAQIEGLLRKFAEAHPEIDPHALAQRIFCQWQQHSK